MRDINFDLELGSKAEDSVKPLLESVFGTLINNNETNQFDNFDFKNDKFYVEHKFRHDLELQEVKYYNGTKYYNIKSLRNKRARINGLMFDKCKYDKYLELKKEDPNLRFFICWTCNPTIDKDKIYYWEFKPDDSEYEEFKMKTDNGRGRYVMRDVINIISCNLNQLSSGISLV